MIRPTVEVLLTGVRQRHTAQMAQRGAGDDWDPPSVVQVTVVAGPRRGTSPARAGASLARAGALATRRLGSLIVVVAAVCAALAGAGSVMFHRVANRPARVASRAVVVDAAPPAARAQAYRFPLGCLRITRTRQALAGAIRRRTDPCWSYGVSVTAILRRVGGAWRLALEARSRSCPRIALPGAVRARLAACRR